MSNSPDSIDVTFADVPFDFDFSTALVGLQQMGSGAYVVSVEGVGLTGPTGPVGAAGSLTPLILVCAEDILQGSPVYIERATSKFRSARADSKPKSFVVGLAVTSGSLGFTVSVQSQSLSLSDWTAITGTTTLQSGQLYFLCVSGGLTTIPPTTAVCLTSVGTAVNSTTLNLVQTPPIQL